MSSAVEIVRSAIDIMREEIRKEICEEIRAQRAASNLRRQEEALRRKAVREVMKEEKYREKEMMKEEKAMMKEAKRRKKEMESQAKQEWIAQVKAQEKEMKALVKAQEKEMKALAKQAKMEEKEEEKLKMTAYVRCECGCVVRTTSMKQHLKGDKHACLLQAQRYESENEM